MSVNSRNVSALDKGIDTIYIDYDDAPIKSIHRDLEMIKEQLAPCVIEWYETGTENHLSVIVHSQLVQTLRTAIQLLRRTSCSPDYINLVILKGGFFMRISPKYVSDSEKGEFVVPEPKLIHTQVVD